MFERSFRTAQLTQFTIAVAKIIKSRSFRHQIKTVFKMLDCFKAVSLFDFLLGPVKFLPCSFWKHILAGGYNCRARLPMTGGLTERNLKRSAHVRIEFDGRGVVSLRGSGDRITADRNISKMDLALGIGIVHRPWDTLLHQLHSDHREWTPCLGVVNRSTDCCKLHKRYEDREVCNHVL